MTFPLSWFYLGQDFWHWSCHQKSSTYILTIFTVYLPHFYCIFDINFFYTILFLLIILCLLFFYLMFCIIGITTNNNKHIIVNKIMWIKQLFFPILLFFYQHVRFQLYLTSYLHMLILIYQSNVFHLNNF